VERKVHWGAERQVESRGRQGREQRGLLSGEEGTLGSRGRQLGSRELSSREAVREQRDWLGGERKAGTK
jgi:hypothetical protein